MAKHDVVINVKQKGAVKATGSMNKLTSALKGVVAGYSALVVARNATQFITSATKAFFKQSSAVTRMNALIKLVPDYNEGMSESFISLSENLQKVGIIADETTQAFIGQMASFKLSGENIKKMLPAVQDYIAATYGFEASQQSAIMTANTLGKAFMGQAGMLARTGVIMSDTQKKILNTGTQAEQTATIISVLNDNYKGVNKELAKTPEGGYTQYLQSFGDAMESVGNAFWKKGGMQESIKGLQQFFDSKEGEAMAIKIGKGFGLIVSPLESLLKALDLLPSTYEKNLSEMNAKFDKGKDKLDEMKEKYRQLGDIIFAGGATKKQEEDWKRLAGEIKLATKQLSDYKKEIDDLKEGGEEESYDWTYGWRKAGQAIGVAKDYYQKKGSQGAEKIHQKYFSVQPGKHQPNPIPEINPKIMRKFNRLFETTSDEASEMGLKSSESISNLQGAVSVLTDLVIETRLDLERAQEIT